MHTSLGAHQHPRGPGHADRAGGTPTRAASVRNFHRPPAGGARGWLGGQGWGGWRRGAPLPASDARISRCQRRAGGSHSRSSPERRQRRARRPTTASSRSPPAPPAGALSRGWRRSGAPRARGALRESVPRARRARGGGAALRLVARARLCGSAPAPRSHPRPRRVRTHAYTTCSPVPAPAPRSHPRRAGAPANGDGEVAPGRARRTEGDARLALDKQLFLQAPNPPARHPLRRPCRLFPARDSSPSPLAALSMPRPPP